MHVIAFCTLLQISEPNKNTLLCMILPCPVLPNIQAALPITEQAVLYPPVLPALQGPPPPDVAELHSQVAAAQASALSSAEALATAQQQVRHKQPGGSTCARPGPA